MARYSVRMQDEGYAVIHASSGAVVIANGRPQQGLNDDDAHNLLDLILCIEGERLDLDDETPQTPSRAASSFEFAGRPSAPERRSIRDHAGYLPWHLPALSQACARSKAATTGDQSPPPRATPDRSTAMTPPVCSATPTDALVERPAPASLGASLSLLNS
ncbi:hypothetical protein [Solimonas terrae]|uniref:Uncharacterized protein n=1 Tax=Solimonas terrae TaxID=1396819 RepID=A0A6M2BQS3_9GAMM|nr:hypothetical protein [Solimonas terrae]NGY04423.1 hypothetical protein [Solimonas terrae]